MNSPAYLAAFSRHDVALTLAHRLTAVRRGEDRHLVATLHSDYAGLDVERHIDHVVVEHGTLPNDELYLDLVPTSTNGGEVDQRALLEGRPQTVRTNHDGSFALFRIGDAVASRNIHAAMYDALRLCLVI